MQTSPLLVAAATAPLPPDSSFGFSDWTAIISALIAIISAVISVIALHENRLISRTSTTLSLLWQTEAKLAEKPDLLELHNVSSELQTRCGATTDEIVYVLNSFTAGHTYYLLTSSSFTRNPDSNIVLTEYRKNLLRNPKVRKIWKEILKGRMMMDSAFTRAVDRFIAETEPKSHTDVT